MAVLALTMHDSEEYFFEVLKAGASGYVPKKAAPTDLVSAIRAVHAGGVFLFPTVAKSLVGDYLKRVEAGGERASYDGLTDREREVLKLIAEGHTNQDIADRLVISSKTVERHRANIMDKLNLHSRTDLVKYAIRKGLDRRGLGRAGAAGARSNGWRSDAYCRPDRKEAGRRGDDRARRSTSSSAATPPARFPTTRCRPGSWPWSSRA